TSWYVFDKRHNLRAGPLRHRADAFKTKALRHEDGKLPKGWSILAVPQGTVVITCGAAAGVCPGVNNPNVTQTYYYLFKFQPNSKSTPTPQMPGSDLKRGGTRQDFDTQPGRPIVLMQFTSHGASVFQKVTAEEWQRGRLDRTPQHFAIVLDGDIKSWPQIDPNNSTL